MSWLDKLMRIPLALGAWQRFPVGSVHSRVYHGIWPYPFYAYGVYWSAYLARQLGLPRITAIELGVAGGRGLLALENASTQIGQALGVTIDVVGFDSGEGMPPPQDYRDLPHIWNTGFYRMEPEKLRARLTSARLILGDVRESTRAFLNELQGPIGFISFDLDYYTSTCAALRLLQGDESTHLPRVHCYFDDVAANDLGCMNPFVGELLAIREFNDAHPERKIARLEQLRLSRPRWEYWQEKMYVFHNFAHAQYATCVIGSEARHTQRPL